MKLFLTYSIFFLMALHCTAQKITVAKDGTGDFLTIQEAIEHFQPKAKKYGTIYIKNGVYQEKILIDSLIHHLIIQGESAEGVIITFTQPRDNWRCEHPDDFGAATVNVKGHHIVFSKLSIINDYGFKAKGDVVIDCENEAGKANNVNAKGGYLPREIGEKEGQKMVRKDGHQFSFRSMPGATFLRFEDCIFRSGGGDTVSPWDVEGGKFYFNRCIIEGHVDLYCPRGNALIENSHFICHNLNAALWHDGSAHEGDMSVIKNCTFEGDPGFKLGRYHREAQMYLFDCTFSSDMADAPIYQSGTADLKWGHRIYYKNCHKEGGDYAWHADNTSLKSKDLKFKNIFGQKW